MSHSPLDLYIYISKAVNVTVCTLYSTWIIYMEQKKSNVFLMTWKQNSCNIYVPVQIYDQPCFFSFCRLNKNVDIKFSALRHVSAITFSRYAQIQNIRRLSFGDNSQIEYLRCFLNIIYFATEDWRLPCA